MAITWTPATRKAISRRIVKIPIENEAFDTSKSGLDDAIIAFQNVDNGNREWFDWYNDDICLHYENEKRYIDGLLLGQVIEQNLLDAANQTTYNIFFEKGADYNPYMYPKINYMVHGLYNNSFRTDGDAAGTFQVWEVNGLQTGQDIEIIDDDTAATTNTYIQNIAGAAAPYTLTIFDRITGAAYDLSAYTVEQNARIQQVQEEVYENSLIIHIDELITMMVDGAVPVVGPGATNLAAPYVVGANSISVVAAAFSNGDIIIGDDGVQGAVFEVTSAAAGAGPFTYSVREISISGNIANGTNFDNNFAGYTDGQRQDPWDGVGPYPNIKAHLADDINDYVYNLPANTWEDTLTFQQTELNLNEEDRAAQQVENSTALADITNAIAQIVAWYTFPNVGVNGRFSNVEVDTLRNELTARPIFIALRLPQIATALGDVIDNNGSYTFGINNTDIYYRRYKIIDYRINRVYGSLSKYIRQSGASDIVGQLKDVNDGWDLEYYSFIRAVRFSKDGDGSNTIYLENTTDFAIGDAIYIISEEQPELAAVIIAISETSVSLNINISEDYKVLDLARTYKTL